MPFFKDKPVPPELVNEHGQITDKKFLQYDRYKFGVGNIMYQGEEIGLMAIHTVIIRALGGTAFHLGFIGAFAAIGSTVQWIGTLLLRKFNSNRKAMIFALSLGVLFAILSSFCILIAYNPKLALFALWSYLVFGLCLAACTGVQWNIETSWIGDLVPKNMLGWFTSVKWAVAVVGVLCFSVFYGKMVDIRPALTTYAGLFVIVALSHAVAIVLIRTVTDRVPKSANFIAAGASRHERLNYKSLPFWCYVSFYGLWAAGRTAMFAFTTAYLLDYFNYSMTKIMLINAIQFVVSVAVLLIMGKITDKRGHRVPLMLMSGGVAFCMSLWVASAWWGITAVIIYFFIHGAAGSTHSMLAMNYGLEIFPDKGRSGYLAISRICIGAFGMTASGFAGFFMRNIEGWQKAVWGTTLTHYHVFFAICSLVAMGCVVPLIIAGKRTVTEVE
jgi:MFS family permease